MSYTAATPVLDEREHRVLASVRVSVVIANFNGMATLPSTIDSLTNYPMSFEDIIVVDDGSSDGSVAWLHQQHPGIRVVEMGRNTANLTRVRNAGLKLARGTHVFLTDNDIELLPGCLEALLQVLMTDPRVFCATPRLVHRDDHERIYQDGNGMHFLALGIETKRGRTLAEAGVEPPFRTCGGGIMLLDLAMTRNIGFFDEGYMHGWADDAELQFRGALYGFQCLHVPAALCTHEAKQHGTRRATGQIHNRFRVVLTFYERRTLMLLAPSLVLFELLLLAGAIAGGFASAYFAAVRATWRARHDVIAVRKELQRRRQVPDRELFWSGSMELPGAVQPNRAVRAVLKVLELAFNANWRLVRGNESIFR